MNVPCWNCGHDIWIETQTECRRCGQVAKRCTDCQHYQRGRTYCDAREVDIAAEEAGGPTTLSSSYRCPDYHQSPVAAQQASARKGAAPLVQPAGPAPTTTARPAPEAAARPTRKRPHVIAHRGWSAVAPENTLAAIKKALEIRADAIEIDVHVTADGTPVVIHDATLDRTTNGTGAVAKTRFLDVRELSAGAWFGEAFAREHVPTLVDAIHAATPPCYLNVHVKCHENESDRAEKAIVAAIRTGNAVGRTWITHHTRHGLHRFRELEPDLRLCWLPQDGGEELEYIDEAYYMGYRIIQPTYRAVTPAFVEYAHDRKVWINVFWADEEPLMRELAGMGVDGILTNHPDRLQEVLGIRPATVSSAP
jgi:glycerophosphoryl diester phosphodiesterase